MTALVITALLACASHWLLSDRLRMAERAIDQMRRERGVRPSLAERQAEWAAAKESHRKFMEAENVSR